MVNFDDSTTQQLFNAFMKFKQINWYDKQIAGYNPSEIKVLFTIAHKTSEENHDMKVSDISKHLNVTSPTITQLINKLEKDQLVLRNVDPSDRRAVNIQLTNKGYQIVHEAHKVLSESFVGLIDFLGNEDSEKLAEILTKVFHYNQQYLR